jgi:UDP-N-acetylglucosamine--N-acetylmuramyl-(pentapeptide) pyrophosphoryl-undecaprenol N-acetylglucosamine transferase
LINIKFRPAVAIGTGGYVAGPAILGSSLLGAKIILVEQNSYPGVTTKLLQSRADEIHISFENSKKYFKEKQKLIVTGNPVRENLVRMNRENSLKQFGFSSAKKTLLILGGSLGAASINSATGNYIEEVTEAGIQIIWQTGSRYYDNYKHLASGNVMVSAFIENMNDAYSACDLVLTRAGATSIAEILTLGVPAILVPSPNVAENHQYHNAKSLADKGAAILLEDKNLSENLAATVLTYLLNENKLADLSKAAKEMSKPEATTVIAQRAISYAKQEMVN